MFQELELYYGHRYILWLSEDSLCGGHIGVLSYVKQYNQHPHTWVTGLASLN